MINKIVLIFILSIIFGGCGGVPSDNTSKVEKGTINIKKSDILQGKLIPLDGEWEYFDREFIEPEKINNQDIKVKSRFVTVPSEIGGETESEKKNGKYGTFRVRIKTDENIGMYALKIPNIKSAYKLWIDGKLIAECGKIAKLKSEYKSERNIKIVYFMPVKNEFEIVVQTSDFFGGKVGIVRSMIIGSIKSINEDKDSEAYYLMIMLGALFIIGIYNIAIYFYRNKESTFLYLGLFCILMSLRTLLSVELLLTAFIPKLEYDTYSKIDLIAFFTAVPLFLKYIVKLFPTITHKIIMKLSIVLAVTGVLMVLVDLNNMGQLALKGYYIITLLLAAYVIYIVVLAVYNRIEGSIYTLIGIIVFIATILVDVAIGTGILRAIEISYAGLLFFTLSQSIVLGIKLSEYFLDSERLEITEKIKEINGNLTQTLNLDEIVLKIKESLSEYVINNGITVYLKKEGFFEKYEEQKDVNEIIPLERYYLDSNEESFIKKVREKNEIIFEEIDEGKINISIPIIYRGETTAVFVLNCNKRENMMEHPEMVSAIAGQAGVAIENANLYKYLENNVDKIKTIEELSGIVYREKDKKKAIQYILMLIVSRIGFGYKRVLYFEFDRKNNVLLSNSKFYTCFNFLNLSGVEVIKEYELSIKSNNFIAKCFNEETPIFSTEYENKDDLFIKSNKIEDFVAVPVTYESNKYGVVLIEALDKGVVFESKRDINILKIFIQNLAIYLENRELEEEGLKTKKLETMVELANSIVHEVKTPLSGIKGYAAIINKKYSEDEKLCGYMSKIISESERIDEMATQLIEYAGKKEALILLEIMPVYVILDNVLKGKRKDIELHNIKVTQNIDERIQVRADIIKLGRAFSYIIKNAIEASKGENDEIIITSKEVGKEYEICIADSGVGIEAHILENVFEPLITTKMQGTGLGLPVAKSIINKHGGRIEIESKKGNGTKVRIYLPHY